MYHHISIVHYKPAFLRFPIYAASFLEILFGCFEHAFGECVEHAIAGAVADYEIIGKTCDPFDIEEQNIFSLLVFQGFDDLMC